MNFDKITTEEMRSFSKEKLKETISDLSKEIVLKSMDVVVEQGKNVTSKRKLKKAYARLLTVRNQVKRS